MFELRGIIEFDPVNVTKKHNKQSSWKKTAMVKFYCDTYEYYSWFIKRRYNIKLNKPIRGTHITAINDIVDDNIYLQARELFNGKLITIKYDPTIVRANNKGHWWLKAQSDDIKNIRTVIGLSPDPYFGLHLTVGLATDMQLEHSNYILEQILKFGEY